MIKLLNEKKNLSLVLDYTGYFLISSVDWGTVNSQAVATKYFKQIGETFRYSVAGTRPVIINGYILGNEKSMLNKRKHLLNQIANVFDEVTIEVNGYEIKGVVNSSPYFGVTESENNEYFCLFRLEFTCNNPLFRKINDQVVELSQWVNNLEFDVYFEEPFEIEYKTPFTYMNVYNNGDIDSFIYLTIIAEADIVNPYIENIETGEFIKFNLTMHAGDILTFNTEDKTFILTQDGISKSVYINRDKSSNLGMKLNVGDNLLRVSADTNGDNMNATINKNELFWGCDWIA